MFKRHFVLAGCLAAPVTLFAQSMLDRVVVTGTRTPTELAEFAGGINRIDNAEISVVGATHHSELLNRVPGANFQRNSGQESLTAIRSPVLTGPGSCGAFLFMEDSIPIRPVGFCNVNELFEVDMTLAQAVEVMRGPAGALYGSSAMHGAVNVLTMNPTQLPTLSVALEGGPDEFARGTGIWSIGGDDNALALGAVIAHDGGWRDDNEVNEQKANAAWRIGLSNSTLDVRGAYSKLDQDTAGFIQGKDAYRDEAIAKSNPNPEAYRDAYAARLNADWALPLNDVVTLNLRPYVRSSRMEFLQHFLIGKPLEENGQDSLGLISTLTGQNENRRWFAGVDVEYADTSLSETQSAPTVGIRPTGGHYDYTVASAVAALYGRYEVTLGKWTVQAGVRGEHVRYDYDNLMSDGNLTDAGTACAGGCLYFRPSDRTDNFTTVTPQLGATLRWAPDHSLYVAATSGYRAPETTELYRIQRQQSTDTPQEEQLDSLELGLRGHAWIIDYDVAVFAMRKENLILREANGLNLADGSTKHRGVEYEFVITPFEQLNFGISGTHAQHTYDFSASLATFETITTGNDVDTAPRNVWNAHVQVLPLDGLSAELEWQHVGEYWVDAANQNSYEGHTVVNFRAAWTFLEDWRVVARVTNLTDRDYADRADFAQSNYRYFPGRGRTGFLEVRWEME